MGKVEACPVCRARVVYVDGYGSPALIFLTKVEAPSDPARVSRVEQEIVGCEACYGKPRPPSAPPRRRPRFAEGRPLAKRAPETRPVGQIIADDAKAVVGLALDVVDVADKVRETWNKWAHPK